MSQSISTGRSSIATVNPYTNEVVRELPPMSPETIDHAVEAAHQAFQSWRLRLVHERAALVGRAAQLLRERSEELARLVTLEIGKLIRHSRAEMDLAVRSAADQATYDRASVVGQQGRDVHGRHGSRRARPFEARRARRVTSAWVGPDGIYSAHPRREWLLSCLGWLRSVGLIVAG
jgi:acyl-CoA reductase-like NAD-dependent aldehyde dehydrogenase